MILKYEAFYLDFLVTCPIWVSVKSRQKSKISDIQSKIDYLRIIFSFQFFILRTSY